MGRSGASLRARCLQLKLTRNADGERRALLRRRGDRDRPPLGVDNLAHDVQAQPDAARSAPQYRFGRSMTHQRIEERRQRPRRDGRAFIMHAQHHGRPF